MSPIHYALFVDAQLTERTFCGSVSIDVARGEPADRIVLDSVGLEITSVTLDGEPAAFEVDASHLTIADDRKSGDARIAVTFRGAMSTDGRGLYVTEGLAVTQLQPSYARMLFPCFDEPRHKATFDVTIAAAKDHAVVSNAAIAHEEIVGDRRRVAFARTPPMPPFLLAMAVGPFAITSADCDGIPVRFLTRTADGRESFALDVAVRCLRFYRDWLGVPYPFTKLDLVAVPQFEVAAMENSGGIVFRESAVLLDTAATPTARRQVAELVAHEVAHQWFGSLVTPASWDELWLSEGFATWLAPKGVAAVSEELAAELDPMQGRRVAMSADSLRSARAMGAGVGTSADVRELFDPIAYQKGAAILRMLEAWLGEEAFRTGVHSYLARNAGGVVTTNDLWHALGEEAGAIAAPFVNMAGVPRLAFDWSGDVVRITQSGARTIPVTMKVALEGGGIVIHRELLREPVTEIRMPSAVTWVFGNAEAAGYYRSFHSPQLEIPTHALTPRETAARLDDLWDDVWNSQTDILAFLRAAGDSGDAALVRSQLVEMRELLAGGARGPVFDRWIVAQFGFALPAEAPSDNLEARLIEPTTRAAAWSHLKAHWDELGKSAITFGGRGVITALGVVADPSMRDDIAAFFSGRNIAGGERALRQTLEQIDSRIWFRERQQRMFDLWLARQSAPAVVASDSLRFAHGFLNALTSGVYGALAGRMSLDRLGVPASAGTMNTSDLRAAHGMLEPLLLQIFVGRPSIDESLLAVGKRLREDLLTTAIHAEQARTQLRADDDAAPMKFTAAQLLRNAAVREQFLGGLVAFSDLFGPAGEAGRWRTQWPVTTAAAADARGLLMRVLGAENTPLLRDALFERSTLLPGTLRSFAVDLAAIEAWLRGDATFDHQAESWRAFGFTPEEAARWKAEGVAQPADAATRQLAVARREVC